MTSEAISFLLNLLSAQRSKSLIHPCLSSALKVEETLSRHPQEAGHVEPFTANLVASYSNYLHEVWTLPIRGISSIWLERAQAAVLKSETPFEDGTAFRMYCLAEATYISYDAPKKYP